MARPLENLPVADIMRVAKRAGLNESFLGDLMAAPPSRFRDAVEHLLADAVREDARWTERVKKVERRVDFAVVALRGGHDDDLVG